MGFCSGTDIFDLVVAVVLKAEVPENVKMKILKALIQALYDHDWDCEADSAYARNPLVMDAFRQLNDG